MCLLIETWEIIVYWKLEIRTLRMLLPILNDNHFVALHATCRNSGRGSILC